MTTNRPVRSRRNLPPAEYSYNLTLTGCRFFGNSALMEGGAVMLAAHALGYGSCWHGVGKRAELRQLLGVAEYVEPRVDISLGRPAETFQVADPSDDRQVKKGDDGVVRLGELGRDKSVIARL